jgi:UDP-galactopyranose mutase
MKLIFSVLVIVLLGVSACKTKEASKSTDETIQIATENEQLKVNLSIEGVVRKQGITTYQYGSHILKTADKYFALRSKDVNLDEYIDKKVKISGEKIEGYPLSGGPEFILVKGIEHIK